MKNEQAGAISVGLIIVLVLVIIFGSFYFYSANKEKKVTKKPLTVQDLEEANAVVERETENLNFLESRYSSERAVIGEIQNQYSKISDVILKKTDALFNNPQTQNPEIKVKVATKKIDEDINSKRLEITEALDSWRDTMELIDSNTNKNLPTLPALVEKAKQDVAVVVEYVKELDKIVKVLTPADSGLTQAQIDTYKSEVAQAVAEAQKANTITEAIIVPVIVPPQNEPSNTTNPPNPETQNTPNPEQPAAPVAPPIVTVEEIKAQEQVVAEAVAQQQIIEQALNATTTPQAEVVVPTPDPVSYPTPGDVTGTPFQGIDKSGWPVLKPEETNGPTRLQGSDVVK